MTMYTIIIRYGPHSRPLPGSPAGGEQRHEAMDEDAARHSLSAFLDDLFRFHGQGVTEVTITAERAEPPGERR